MTLDAVATELGTNLNRSHWHAKGCSKIVAGRSPMEPVPNSLRIAMSLHRTTVMLDYAGSRQPKDDSDLPLLQVARSTTSVGQIGFGGRFESLSSSGWRAPALWIFNCETVTCKVLTANASKCEKKTHAQSEQMNLDRTLNSVSERFPNFQVIGIKSSRRSH